MRPTQTATLWYLPFLILILSLDLSAADAPATYIGSHRIGETFQEWLAATEPSLISVCKNSWSEKVHSCGTQPLLGNRDVGEWMRESDAFDQCERTRAVNERSCKQLSDLQAGKAAFIETLRSPQGFAWEFMDGKLSKVTIVDPTPSVGCAYFPNISELVGFLVQKYGKPSEEKTVTFQNSFGASWAALRDSWRMPDGTAIIASENIGRQCTSGPRRELLILFLSKDLLERETQQQKSKPNPFDR